jgi:RNA polymerase primary sigma factor
MLKVTKKREKKESIDEVVESNVDGLFFKDVRKIKQVSHDEERKMWEKYFKTNDSKILDKIVKNNIRFAITTANEFRGICEAANIDIKDLYQEASIGLVTAAHKYTLDKKTRFISYAVWWIRQGIYSFLSEYSREIRLPLNIVNDLHKEKKKKEELFKKEESGDGTDISVPTVTSIYSTINDEGDELIDLIPNNNIESPDNVDKFDMKKELESLINDVLDEREKKVILMYHGMDGNKNCKLEDVGEELGLTKERVRQIKEIALKKLRTNSRKLFKLR